MPENRFQIRVIAKNKRAFFEYEILEKLEAGLALSGTEVKSVRAGKVSLLDGWVEINDEGQALLKQVHIAPWEYGNIYNHDEMRVRQLLLKKRELIRLKNSLHAKGLTLVPLRMYLKGRLVKVELGLGKGKKLHDKRSTTQEREANRAMERAMKRQV
ncbi:MAG: SsrA-binding protein SmpB [Deltaproteobacteria bacterium]|nr:SsrA-binding protein SmpB [Deltaproteobacteria bacterium]